MNCPNCGKEIYAIKNFCKYCGYKLSVDDKWENIQNHESLEKQVLIKCGIIAIAIIVMMVILTHN